MVRTLYSAATLSALVGVVSSTNLPALQCLTNRLAVFMEVLPAYAAPFCASAAHVTIKTPTMTILTTPTV